MYRGKVGCVVSIIFLQLLRLLLLDLSLPQMFAHLHIHVDMCLENHLINPFIVWVYFRHQL